MRKLIGFAARRVLMVGLVLGFAAPSVMAQWPPFIHAAATDATETTLLIWGERFTPGSQVWLAQQQLTIVGGGLSDTMITALLPAGQLQPGSYVLRLIDPPLGRQGRSNVFEVTLGEVGPAGAPGTNGVDGVDGVDGVGLPGAAGANCYDGIVGGTSVLDCQGAPGAPGTPADVCAVFAAMGTVPLFGTGLPCSPTVRFVDNGDGTVTDNQTGLMWEQKNSCAIGGDLNDVHCVNNLYQWSNTGTNPDGSLFTDFLAKLNTTHETSFDAVNIDRPNYEDWRIPSIVESGGMNVCQS